MNVLAEAAVRIVFRVAARLALGIALRATLPFLRRTGDFLIDLATLDYFRDHSKVPMRKKPLHPVPAWTAALLGFGFWCAFAAAAFRSWPWLSRW